MSEMSVQSKLQVLRSEQENYLEDSFGTICAYKEHAAMMHYSSKPETNVEITNSGMLLIDSGGQYLEGTQILRVHLSWEILVKKKDIGSQKLCVDTFVYPMHTSYLDVQAST